MGEWMDYYRVLQVHPEAEPEVIQGAYKRLCKKYHPDVNADPGAAGRMRQINEAWHALGDPDARRRFHGEWRRRHEQPAQTVVRDRIVYREVVSQAAGTYEAHRVLHTYFDALSNGRLRDAFAQVSQRDQSCFGYEQFARWQQAVARSYEIGCFTLALFKGCPTQPMAGQGLLAEEYTVTLWEKNKRTGAVRQYAVAKTVIREGGQWRVFLGYEDLAPLIAKFTAGGEQDRDRLDGLPNQEGFVRRLEEEIGRFRRCGQTFAVALIAAEAPDAVQTYLSAAAVGGLLRRAVRMADVVAYLGQGCFGVLLTGTEQAQPAVQRLTRVVRQVSVLRGCTQDIRASVRVYAGGTSAWLLQSCRMQLERRTG